MVLKPYNRPYAVDLLRVLVERLDNADDFAITAEILFDGEKNTIFHSIRDIVDATPHQKHLIFLSSQLSGSWPLHATAMYIDTQTRTIRFQDPYGTKADTELRAAVSDNFPDYVFHDSISKQQEDNVSCAVITVDNLIHFALGISLPLRPDIVTLRQKHAAILPLPTARVYALHNKRKKLTIK